MVQITRPKGASFATSDQGLFTSAIDLGCRATLSAPENTVIIKAGFTTLAATTGGIILVPYGISHSFTAADFPLTGFGLCLFELTATSCKFIANKTFTSNIGNILEQLAVANPKMTLVDFSETVTAVPAYTYKFGVYNNADTPVIAGSSYDFCTFLPGASAPAEVIARSGTIAGLHYFYHGIDVTGVVRFSESFIRSGIAEGSRSIQDPLTATAIVCEAGIQHLILNHAATIAALTVTLPVTTKDGANFKLFSRSVVTALTLTPGAGNLVATGHGITATTALGSYEWVYNLADTSWYRVK